MIDLTKNECPCPVFGEVFGEDCINTRRFWLKYGSRLPNLFRLTKNLLIIAVSTAFVKRFFSICGIICSLSCNMSDKTLIIKAILKTYFKTLNQSNIKNDDYYFLFVITC